MITFLCCPLIAGAPGCLMDNKSTQLNLPLYLSTFDVLTFEKVIHHDRLSFILVTFRADLHKEALFIVWVKNAAIFEILICERQRQQ